MALEQTSESISLEDYVFPEKVLLLLGKSQLSRSVSVAHCYESILLVLIA